MKQTGSFFVGFRHNYPSKDDSSSMLGIGIFPTQEKADALFGKSEAKVPSVKEKEGTEGVESLASISAEFFEQFIAMLDLLPMGASSTMLIKQLLLQDMISSHVAPRATTITKGNGEETYELPKPLLPEIGRRMSRATRIAKSVDILPSIALLGLVSQFDGFVGRILRRIYEIEPRKISNGDKTVLVSDVFAASSIEQFQSELVDKEVDKVLRGSHAQQIEHFEKILNTEIRKSISDWDVFLEIFERRNLFAHTGGKVSKSYLDKTASKSGKEIGEYLDVSPEYLHRAVSILLEVGLKIIQIVGRTKFVSKSGDFPDIDEDFIAQAYELLIHGHYSTAKIILDFSLDPGMKIDDPVTKIIISVNRAICYREAGHLEKAVEILKPYHNMPLEPRFRIPILAVSDEVDKACDELEIATKQHLLAEEVFGWPAFRWIHGNERFREIISGRYPNEYAALEFLLGNEK